MAPNLVTPPPLAGQLNAELIAGDSSILHERFIHRYLFCLPKLGSLSCYNPSNFLKKLLCIILVNQSLHNTMMSITKTPTL